MSTPIAVEVNCETKQVTERPLTDAEITQREADAAAAAVAEAEREAEEEAKAASMASALAKLSALGLTDDEVAALTPR
jgi:hypothetical protein